MADSAEDGSRHEAVEQDAAQPPPPEGAAAPPNPLLQKYEEYRSALATNPEDFQTWTYLLGTVERLDDMGRLVEVFDTFLASYPLCYGYWKKYADAALKHQGLQGAVTVYERGLAAIPYSVDLWGHYLTFIITKANETADTIRSFFERGLAYVGNDFLCHILWDKYFQYELDQKEWQRAAQLFRRVLSMACKELEGYHGKFVKFAEEHELSEMLSTDEIQSYRELMIQKKSEKADGDVQMQEDSTIETEAVTSPDAMEPEAMDPDSDAAVKAFWVQSMKELYDATNEELTQRKLHEDLIKRPYFHVKPLDKMQLQAWWKYLDAVRLKDDHRETVILFERCLVACALYPEFWMRYVAYMEPRDASEALNILQRALQVFCKNKSEIHLFAAHFYERRGDLESARSCLEAVTSRLAPSMLSAVIQHANFEYRHEAPEAANALYEARIKAELETEGSETVGFLATQYAYVQWKRLENKEKAREVLQEVLNARPDLMGAWEGAVQIEELMWDETAVERVTELYKRCTAPPEEDAKGLELQDRYVMSGRLLKFLDFHGEPEVLGEMQRRHLELFGLCSVVPSLHRKRTEATKIESAAKKQAQGDGTPTSADTKTTTPMTSAAMAEYFAQNPAAQQYAQYYQYAAAAAAAGYGAYAGYNTSYSG